MKSKYFPQETLAGTIAAEGEARGEAKALLLVLKERGFCVSDALRERVESCTDTAELETWLGRAATANSIDEVFEPTQK
jgi:hypothetical protein